MCKEGGAGCEGGAGFGEGREQGARELHHVFAISTQFPDLFGLITSLFTLGSHWSQAGLHWLKLVCAGYLSWFALIEADFASLFALYWTG